MIGMSQNLRLVLMGMGVMAIVAIGGLYAVDAFTPTVDHTIAPVYAPQNKVKETPQAKDKKSEDEILTSETDNNIAHFVAERPSRSLQYQSFTHGARQIFKSINVRISNAPISTIEQEGLESLAYELSKAEYQGQTIYLLSFAETVGSIFVAEERARFAQKVLNEKYGISNAIQIEGFAPDNVQEVETQRIEVWVK